MFGFRKKVNSIDITNCVPVVLSKMFFEENNEMNIHYHVCYKNIDTKKCFWKTNKIVESNKWFSEYLAFIKHLFLLVEFFIFAGDGKEVLLCNKG